MPLDDLITKFSGDDASYLAAVNRVKASTSGLIARLQQVPSNLMAKFNLGGALAPLAAAATAGGLIELGKNAVQTSRDFDTLERRIRGVVGSLQRARQLMQFGESQSNLFGQFSPEEIDSVSVKLEAFGLRAERMIPTIQALASIFGDGAGSMEEFATALGAIKEGNMTRAIMFLSRHGVSVQDLKSQGVIFKGRTPESSPDQVIDAVNRVVAQKFGKEMATLEEGGKATGQRLANAWTQDMRTAGSAIDKILAPVEKSLTGALDRIRSSGAIDRLVDDILGIFGVNTKGLTNAFNGIDSSASSIHGWLQKIKSVADAFREVAGTVLSVWAKLPPTLQEAAIWMLLLNRLGLGVGSGLAGSALGGLAKLGGGFLKGAMNASGLLGAGVGSMGLGEAAMAVGKFGGVLALATADVLIWKKVIMDAYDEIQNRKAHEEFQKSSHALFAAAATEALWEATNPTARAMKAQGATHQQLIDYFKTHTKTGRAWEAAHAGKDGDTDKDKDKDKDENRTLKDQLEQLRLIQQNTKAVTVDLRRYALGGSGTPGVTPIEVQNLRRGSPGRGRRGVAAALSDAIEAYTAQMIAESQAQGVRQRYQHG